MKLVYLQRDRRKIFQLLFNQL